MEESPLFNAKRIAGLCSIRLRNNGIGERPKTCLYCVPSGW